MYCVVGTPLAPVRAVSASPAHVSGSVLPCGVAQCPRMSVDILGTS